MAQVIFLILILSFLQWIVAGVMIPTIVRIWKLFGFQLSKEI